MPLNGLARTAIAAEEIAPGNPTSSSWQRIWLVLLPLFLLWGGRINGQELQRYWVYFKGKDALQREILDKAARRSLSSRSVQRRLLRLPPGRRFDSYDLPVSDKYVDEVAATGARVHVRSRWLNAVSVEATDVQLAEIQRLPFVRKIAPVRTFYRRTVPPAEIGLRKQAAAADTNRFDYGFSAQQIEQLKIPALHNRGLSGRGVLITLIDTGFYYQLHRAFRHLHVVAEWDFINHDPVTRNQPGQDAPYQHDHGTEVLSVIGGFLPGKLIGPAYGADFALAKTEYVPSETRIEEDNWVAAAEWADSLGADVISTSLGYRDFDDGFSYTYSDLNGTTMVTSKAASIAVAKGIVVVASAGNEGNNPDWPYITSPADGIGVIAAGAVDAQGRRVSFSSIGPTADGRIKPDVMAMGLGDAMVDPADSVGLNFGSGTSFAAPLVAGVCALLLEQHPSWTPDKVWQALTETASQATAPDNRYGWGIVNAEAADDYIFPEELPEKFALAGSVINPDLGYSVFEVDLPEAQTLRVILFDVLGRRAGAFQTSLRAGAKRRLVWTWPASLASGVYFARIAGKNRTIMAKTLIYR